MKKTTEYTKENIFKKLTRTQDCPRVHTYLLDLVNGGHLLL